jgi:hypothetical protein
MEDRNEHLAWCKKRALEYLDAGDLNNAVTSMLSDLSKHPELRGIGSKMGMIGIFAVKEGPRAVRRFIEGFN